MDRPQPPDESAEAPRADAEPRGQRFVFSRCVLDTRTLQLSVDGAAVRLERKPLEVLIFLLAHAGEVVTKDELLEEVWQGRVLSESVLTKCIAKLRQGLGDEDQSVVRTVHGYGYRLVADVRVEQAVDAPVRLLPELKAGDAPPLRPLWRLERRLGSGGFGEAWLAQHSKTGDKRVFKFGADAAGLAALRREITLHRVLRQALGERQDFVRLMDWNLAEPPCYLEVEYIDGGSLVEWAQAAGGLESVSRQTRIELIAQIADALAAAHAVGVLHKDLKPGNVLVAANASGDPQIRLADFGSGLLTDPARLEAMQITRLDVTMDRDTESSGGTPLYLAPELLHGQIPTARSDIYALGVMLYQMLVGDLRKPLAVGWEQDIDDELLREDISAAAEGRPEQRLGDAGVLAKRLRGLEARRQQREAEQAARAESARLEVALENARRRRRRLGAVSVVLALALSVVTALLFQVRAAQERARSEADIAGAVNEFLTTDLLGQANPMISGRRDVSVRELLDVAAEEAGRRFAGREATEAGVRLAVGSAYRNLAEYERAQEQLHMARQLASRPGIVSDVSAQAQLELGRLHVSQDQPAQAINVVASLLEASDARLRLQAGIITAWAMQNQGDFEASLARLQQLLPQVQAHYGENSATAVAVLGHQAVTLEKLSRYEEAIATHQQELDATQEIYGAGHVQTLRALRGLGAANFMLGRFDAALAYVTTAHEIAIDVLGADHDETLTVASDLGLLYTEIGEHDRGEQIMLETLERRIQLFGEGSRDARSLLNNLGLFYGERGDLARELDFIERAYLAELGASGERNPLTLVAAHNLARAMGRIGRLEEAEVLERHTLEIAHDVFGAEHAYIGIMGYTLADILGKRGELAAAEAAFEEAIALLNEVLTPDNAYSVRANLLREEMRERQPIAAGSSALAP